MTQVTCNMFHGSALQQPGNILGLPANILGRLERSGIALGLGPPALPGITQPGLKKIYYGLGLRLGSGFS
mgnify:CR=1 FL=1